MEIRKYGIWKISPMLQLRRLVAVVFIQLDEMDVSLRTTC
jgi:hypothetical protein